MISSPNALYRVIGRWLPLVEHLMWERLDQLKMRGHWIDRKLSQVYQSLVKQDLLPFSSMRPQQSLKTPKTIKLKKIIEARQIWKKLIMQPTRDNKAQGWFLVLIQLFKGINLRLKQEVNSEEEETLII